jgi:excisionase family DNA binding protein
MMQKLKHAAKELSVSERFLRQLIAAKRIPFYRLSDRTLRVDVAELRDLMRMIAEGEPNLDNIEGTDDDE